MIARLPTGLILPWHSIWNLHAHTHHGKASLPITSTHINTRHGQPAEDHQ